ncbi:MAG: protocatechuate 3,4-dioxygenase subunit alpha [Gaiellales bacterium]
MTLERTPSQTVGPFFEFGLCERVANEVVPLDAPGAIRIEGRVFDGAGAPVPDAMIEIWPAFGRCGTDADGHYSFVTERPPARPGQAPHLSVLVFARGLVKPVRTRLYFPGDDATGRDPVLTAIPDARERASLIAVTDGDVLRFDVHLQGARQTAFFRP